MFIRDRRVDKAFFDRQHKINVDGTVSIVNGSAICGAVTVADHFAKENEKKREIYILKQEYFQSFVSDFKRNNMYKKSKNYVDKKLKYVD